MGREFWLKLLVYCCFAIPVLSPALRVVEKVLPLHQLQESPLLFSHKSLGGAVSSE